MTEEQKTRALALVAELRSGKWVQIEGMLQRDEDHACCLGVGCSLAAESGCGVSVVPKGGRVVYDHMSSYLPLSVLEWYGFATATGEFQWMRAPDPLRDYVTDLGLRCESLAALNDRSVPFTRIAAIIEDEVLNGNRRGLFT